MSTAALPVHANNNSEFEGHVEARSGRIVEVKLDAREIMNGLRTNGDKVTDLVKSCRAAWDFEGCPWIEAECDKTGNVGDKQIGELFVIGHVEENVEVELSWGGSLFASCHWRTP